MTATPPLVSHIGNSRGWVLVRFNTPECSPERDNRPSSLSSYRTCRRDNHPAVAMVSATISASRLQSDRGGHQEEASDRTGTLTTVNLRATSSSDDAYRARLESHPERHRRPYTAAYLAGPERTRRMFHRQGRRLVRFGYRAAHSSLATHHFAPHGGPH
jgi:hypothetical protein